MRPVLTGAQLWHRDHAFGDLCAACHGGEPRAASKDEAHVGVRQPLQHVAASCSGCHPSDAQARAEAYVARAYQARPAAPPAAASGASSGNVIDLVLALCSLVLIAASFLDRRGVAGAWHWHWPRLRVALRRPDWGAYVPGVALGVLVACSEVFLGRPIAVSGAFDKLAAYVGQALFPHSQYYAHSMLPSITWQVWTVLGILLGSWLSSALCGQARLRWLPDSQWRERFGGSRPRRLALAFVGAVLVQFGAGIAGGCTSGLAISGGAALAPGAFVFMAGMFASGIPTARFWYRKRSS